MTRHDPLVSVRQMLDHAREAVQMVRGRTRNDLDTDRQLNLALVRLVEVIGEAAARVPEEFRLRYARVHWRQTIGSAAFHTPRRPEGKLDKVLSPPYAGLR